MQIPRWFDRNFDERAGLQTPPANRRPAKLMRRHGNPNRHIDKTSRCNAALQISASSCDDLTDRTSGEAVGGVLYLICSL
jgi:hypothetical protein